MALDKRWGLALVAVLRLGCGTASTPPPRAAPQNKAPESRTDLKRVWRRHASETRQLLAQLLGASQSAGAARQLSGFYRNAALQVEGGADDTVPVVAALRTPTPSGPPLILLSRLPPTAGARENALAPPSAAKSDPQTLSGGPGLAATALAALHAVALVALSEVPEARRRDVYAICLPGPIEPALALERLWTRRPKLQSAALVLTEAWPAMPELMKDGRRILLVSPSALGHATVELTAQGPSAELLLAEAMSAIGRPEKRPASMPVSARTVFDSYVAADLALVGWIRRQFAPLWLPHVWKHDPIRRFWVQPQWRWRRLDARTERGRPTPMARAELVAQLPLGQAPSAFLSNLRRWLPSPDVTVRLTSGRTGRDRPVPTPIWAALQRGLRPEPTEGLIAAPSPGPSLAHPYRRIGHRALGLFPVSVSSDDMSGFPPAPRRIRAPSLERGAERFWTLLRVLVTTDALDKANARPRDHAPSGP